MKRIEFTVVLEVENPYDLDWMEKDLTSWIHKGAEHIQAVTNPETYIEVVGTSIGTIGES